MLRPLPVDNGLEITDLQSDTSFAARPIRTRNITAIPEAMRRIAHAFVEDPESILQVLVETAVEFCSADSSAISLEIDEAVRTEEAYYNWVAIAGQYAGMYNTVFPHYPTGCAICLERGRPQQIRASNRFFDILGVTSPPVTDGLMFPLQTGETRGTIYILAHEREEAFDLGDVQLMEILADFAAIGVRHLHQQKLLMERAGLVAEAAMANKLAHKINNPLQGLTNILFMAKEGYYGNSAKDVGLQAADNLERLSSLIREILRLPLPK